MLYSITISKGKALRSKLLVVSSLALLIATAYVVVSYGQSVYFVTFHRPLHFGFSEKNTANYVSPALPTFLTNQTISASALYPGETQKIAVTTTASQNIAGYMKVWIEGPSNKQVFQSDTDGSPTQFTKGVTRTFTYSYTIPKNLLMGTYKVSVIITSADSFTDYYVKPNFATFTVS